MIVSFNSSTQTEAYFSDDMFPKYAIVGIFETKRSSFKYYGQMIKSSNICCWNGYSQDIDHLLFEWGVRKEEETHSNFIRETFQKYNYYFNVNIYILKTPNDCTEFIEQHQIKNPYFISLLWKNWIHERRINP